MTERNAELPHLNSLQNGEIIDRDFDLDAKFERSSAWMKPLKRGSSSGTSSTLMGSSQACSKRTLETYSTASKRTLETYSSASRRTLETYNTDSRRTIDTFYPSENPCVWSRMLNNRGEEWDDDYNINDHSSSDCDSMANQSCIKNVKRIAHGAIYELRHCVHTLRNYPYILISTLCMITILLLISLLTYKLGLDWDTGEITIRVCVTTFVVVDVILVLLISMMFMMIIIQRQRYKQLLFKVIPQSAVQKLHRKQTVIERFNLVTIFSLDIVDFTSIAAEMKPIKAMEMLNELYASFDSIVEKYDLFKVETSGDTYMVVGGVSNRTSASEAAETVALFALEATEFVKNFKTSMGDKLSIRVGIASGPAMAGVVGKSMPRYCFFGETVNFALRMRLSSRTMKIQCSDATFGLLNDAPNHFFDIEERREDGIIGVEVKGRGIMNTWWINGTTEGENIKPTKTKDTDIENGRTGNLKPQLSCVQFDTIVEQVSLKMGQNEDNLTAKNIQRDEMINQRAQPSYYHAQYGTDVQFEALTGQAWSKLGQDEGPLVMAIANRNIMVDRIASLLEMRLTDVLQARNQHPFDDVTRRELRAYVAHIETLYNDVEYHSFEHASHVTISMNKLLNAKCASIHRPQDEYCQIGSDLCENPFISFMMVYSALVHDVGHTGKSNQILEEQNEEMFQDCLAPLAERLSINIAVQALGMNEFSNLRKMIMPTIEDKIEFAKILFCAILCTDVACQDTLKVVKERFDVATTVNRRNSINSQNTANRRNSINSKNTANRRNSLQNHHILHSSDSATFNPSVSDHFQQRICPLMPHLKYIHKVISLTDEDIAKNQDRFLMTETALQQYVAVEHLMQVADVAHCMQGWENFIKWNYRLYRELMDCHKKNLMPDISGNWAIGQIKFFNGYILPLAERTEKCCGLAENFSLVQLAESNRLRWENEGQFITAIFISAVKNGEEEKNVLKKCFTKNDEIL